MSINSVSLKKTIAMLLVMTSLSCSSSNESVEELPYLTVKSVSSINLSASGGETIISVSSYPKAVAQSSTEWLTLKSTTQLDKLSSFVFVAKANESGARESIITIIAGEKKETITVSQAKNNQSESKPIDENQPAVKVAKELGLGWNLGNQLDAYVNDVADETSWGNGKATQETFNKVKNAGFTSVRIPITWLGKVSAAPGYTIDLAWLNRAKELVDYAENAGLKVIINIHHDGYRHVNEDGSVKCNWLDIVKASEDVITNNATKVQLKAMWTQIAEHFKDKGDFLIFEGLNEIHDGKWGMGSNTIDGGKQYAILNEWQQVFVDAVRATGGNNAARYLGISGYCTNPDLTMKFLKIPSDPAKDRLLVSVHYYDPATFALEDKFTEWGHTGAVGSKDVWGDEAHLNGLFAALRTTYVEKGIPVYIGEMGCVHRNNVRSELFRKYYLEYVCKAARTNGMAVFYWDNGSAGSGRECSGVINHATGDYVNNGKDIVNVMAKGYFTDDVSYTLATVYQNAP
ncbi:cellulase family glycosylhydrolase [Bacteroides sp.]|uniref:cellulase family glycosylhydrolase n=1 Tax=Bacteroides sp. TaxID=29523 RepID=UPI00260AA2A2|nr:cellulase family glycosylhydrolase [Bacteroides sp.]